MPEKSENRYPCGHMSISAKYESLQGIAGIKLLFAAAVLVLALPELPAGPQALGQTPGREDKEADKEKTYGPILKELQDGATYKHEMMPMRDGVKLATAIYLPPGKGPWPTVLVRTPYGRFGLAGYAKQLKKGNYAFVTQDPRGDGDSEGKGTFDPKDNVNEINDGYDCIEWIAAQPWSNGRVGMFGGSGHGMCAHMAFLSKAPHLTIVAPGNSAGNTYLYWGFQNGVRKGLYNWLLHRGLAPEEWPKPTPFKYDFEKWDKIVKDAAKDNKTIYICDDGYFNIFGDCALDMFEYLGPTCRIFSTFTAKAHGKLDGLAFPWGKYAGSAPQPVPTFLEILDGKDAPEKGRLEYFVMGDVRDQSAPGSCRKVTNVWPPPHTPTSFYFYKDGKLDKAPPTDKEATVTYKYDPKDPAPTIGGGYNTEPKGNGALDQRELKDRKDMLLFATAELTEPIEIAGRVSVELYFSTDVPDTLFIAKLLDIYPDGYQAIMREGPAMARYRDDFKKPSALEKGKPYDMLIPVGGAAVAFNKGHKIGLIITSSSKPAFEVHPNSFEPVRSYDASPVANQIIYMTPGRPSCLILPIVK
ncbi:MAG: CocE/NonD family hydrolase [Planctomycetes bacterium]|nr:CocE/NonD family hydrolase [Planctomycetota bacterium]